MENVNAKRVAVRPSAWLDAFSLLPLGAISDETCETHFCRRRFRPEHSAGNHFTDHWAMLEAVSRASANNPDVLRLGMAI